VTAIEPAVISAELLDLPIDDFAARFRSWLADNQDAVGRLLAPGCDFDLRVEAARGLRQLLWDTGWARYGWPELVGGAGKELKLKALLVGPGAYAGRLPRWAMWLAEKIAGNRITRVPIDRIRSISGSVQLDRPGDELGLHRSEKAAGKWIPRRGAL